MAKASALYGEDFVRWTEEQAAALRRAKGSNLPLDWENLAEEIESLGKSDRRELRSQIRRILRHLLKLEVSSAKEPRAEWRTTIREARSEIESWRTSEPQAGAKTIGAGWVYDKSGLGRLVSGRL